MLGKLVAMRQDRQKAMTLLEVLVVIAILSIVVAFTVPAVQRARSTASRLGCANNLRQIGLAIQQFHESTRRLPAGTGSVSRDRFPYLHWHARILPFMERQDQWRKIEEAYAQRTDFLWVPPHNERRRILPFYLCPADARNRISDHFASTALTSYQGVSGEATRLQNGVLYMDSVVTLRDVTDGISQTLLVGERPPSADRAYGWWYAGWGQGKDGSLDAITGVRELNYFDNTNELSCSTGPYHFVPGQISEQCDVFHYWSLHPGGAHFAFCDGSVRFLAYSANPIMPALATRAGGEAQTTID